MPATKTDQDEVTGSRPKQGETPSCEWNESVCLHASENMIIYTGSTDKNEVLTYCARHYVLTLAELLEVHLPGCNNPVTDHVRSFGSI